MANLKVDEQVFNAATTGTSMAIDVANCNNIVCYAEWSTGTTAGVITLETAHTPNFGGTWKSLGTMTQSANTAGTIELTGKAYRYVRARISTTVTGGTVSAWIVANG